MKVSIIGGGMAGLSAATYAADKDVTLYDAQGYDNRCIKPWGGGISDYRPVPRSIDAQGVLRRIDKVVAVNDSSQLDIRTQYGAIIQRDKFEKVWGKELKDKIQIAHREVTHSKFWNICKQSDLVIDATGVEPISYKIGKVKKSSLRGRTISAVAVGDFERVYPTPHIRGYYSGYSWVNPLTKDRAVIGLGTYEQERNADANSDPSTLLHQVAKQFGVRVEQIQRGPDSFPVPIIGGRKTSSLEYTAAGAHVRLVGDAASLANGITGTGLTRAARSAGEAVTTPIGESYPANLRQAIHMSQTRNLVQRYTDINQILNFAPQLADTVRYEPLFERAPMTGIKHIVQQAFN